MILTIGKKKYTLKFGYKAVAKSGIIKKALNIEKVVESENYGDMIEEMLSVVADMVLAGLQKTDTHFNVNYDDKDDVRGKTEMVYDLLDDYMAQEDALTITEIFQALMTEMFEAGFFGNKSQKMEQVATEQNATVIPMDHLS